MTDSPSRNKTESPKTPGGISKSLLTPCRRVGLSRKWKKSSCSPFISPLSTQDSNKPDSKEKECKKRRKCSDNEVDTETPSKTDRLEKQDSCNSPQCNVNITTTPSRNPKIPRKKSKSLRLSQEMNQEVKKDELANSVLNKVPKEATIKEPVIDVNVKDSLQTKDKAEKTEKVVKLSRSNSKSKSKLSLKKSHSKSESKIEKHDIPKVNVKRTSKESPNNLTKECIVVIQKKILNDDEKPIESIQESDAELDVPLCKLKKEKDTVTLNTLNDEDFISTKKQGKKKLSLTIKRNNSANESEIEIDKSSQSSQENDDILNKRTILIRKSYNKVDKPQRAKSTGSITQKDIDELKARIEMKKKLLLAKAMSVETEELRSLIKKWQKGCQEALMELLELMKKKLPDRPNMDYAEILKLLNIPAELVGYDSDNDCFVTPEDTNILLNSFKL